MEALTNFTINTNIFEGEKAINAICILGACASPEQKEQLHIIDSFVQNIWRQMTQQQFPDGINEKTTVTLKTPQQ